MQSYMTGYYQARQHPSQTVGHMFCTLGNGVELDNCGYLKGNYRDEDIFKFPEPTALTAIYPWIETPEFQPFRKVAGCRDVGFRATCEYFLACLELTPDTVEHAAKWKENIETVRKVLLDTPTITDKLKGTDDMEGFLALIGTKDTSYASKWDRKPDGKNSVQKVWFFDVQWSDCPEEVEKEVRHMWRDYELGNDHFMVKRELDEELFEAYPMIYMWLKHKGVQEGEQAIIHWWW